MSSHERPLRFGFVSTMSGVPWGGSEQLWSEVALRLRSAGHAVAASVYRWPTRPPALDELAARGVQIAFRSRRPGFVDRTWLKVEKRFGRPALPLSHRRWLAGSSADFLVISQGGPWDGVPWMVTCRRLGIPYCAIVQANSEHWWPIDERMPDTKEGLLGAARIYFVSEANRRLMELQLGTSLPHGEVIANPCKVDRDVSAPWPNDTGTLRLACVGRLSPNAKGQDVLFQVLAQEKWRKRALELHVYGSGPSEESVKALASHLRLNQVTFHGQVSDIRAIWADNHALVLPSRFEGLPLTIMEAMLCARPVITTDVAGNAEVVTDNLNGFIAPAATIALLDDAMERAWARRHEWRAMGQQGRAAVLRLVPKDPVGDFTGNLLALAQRHRRGSAIAPALPEISPDPAAQPLANARELSTP